MSVARVGVLTGPRFRSETLRSEICRKRRRIGSRPHGKDPLLFDGVVWMLVVVEIYFGLGWLCRIRTVESVGRQILREWLEKIPELYRGILHSRRLPRRSDIEL